PEAFLVRLHTAEFAKRSGRLAARRTEGAGRTTVTAERFVTRKRDSWEAFRILAARAERVGLKQLGAAEIPDFAARYREVAADLARARTYGVDPRVLEYLERVVSAGHNALYGRHTGHRVHVGRLVLRELPAAVVAARAYVVTALLVFAVPAATGYVMIRERPAIAEQVLPDEMLARSAIFIAGGAGLLVARALLAPGDLTRRDALVLAGRQAARLVGASVLLLALAGTIEGLLSASDAPAPLKVATGGATVVLLILYLASGRHYLNTHAMGPSGEGAATAASGTDPH